MPVVTESIPATKRDGPKWKIASCQLAQRKISGVMYPVSPIQPELHSSQLVIVGRVGWQDTNLLSRGVPHLIFAMEPGQYEFHIHGPGRMF